MEYPEIPVCQIRHDLLVCYTLVEYPRRHQESNSQNDYKLPEPDTTTSTRQKQKGNQYSGEMRKGTIKRMKAAIDALISIAEPKTVKHPTKDYTFTFKHNFITLTLPAPQRDIEDQDITNKALKPLLEYLKDHYEGISYIWKAERQLNGNLHYHITTDRFIPHDILKERWNYYLRKFPFIKEFASKHGHSHPNSTDIHATHAIKNWKQYMVKYFTKGRETVEELTNIPWRKQKISKPHNLKPGQLYQRVLTREEAKIKGKTWDCSLHLKQAKRANVHIDYKLHKALTDYLKEDRTRGKSSERCQMIFIKRNEWKNYLPPIIQETFDQWVLWIRDKANRKKQEDSPPAQHCPF